MWRQRWCCCCVGCCCVNAAGEVLQPSRSQTHPAEPTARPPRREFLRRKFAGLMEVTAVCAKGLPAADVSGGGQLHC